MLDSPYIIVQHLSPDFKSLLGEILGKYTEMPVVQVENGMEVKPNCVYVIQPGKNMRISKGKLLLSVQSKDLNMPIDMFFRSLAEEAGPRAIAIVLRGIPSNLEDSRSCTIIMPSRSLISRMPLLPSEPVPESRNAHRAGGRANSAGSHRLGAAAHFQLGKQAPQSHKD